MKSENLACQMPACDIVVTGAGIVSAIGIGKEQTLDSLLAERTGIAPLRYLNSHPLAGESSGDGPFLVGEVKLSDEEMKQRLGITREPTTRTSLMAMLALEEALRDADLWPDSVLAQGLPLHRDGSTPRIALVSGTTVGGMDKSEQFYLDFLANDTRNDYILTHDCGSTTELIASVGAGPVPARDAGEPPALPVVGNASERSVAGEPTALPVVGNASERSVAGEPPALPDAAADLFSLVLTPSTACSSAANAIVTGANLLRSGMADIAVVGGAECLSRFHLHGFNSLMIIDHGQCRPFDADRAGLNLGEGAAYLVLERADHARERGRLVREGADSLSATPTPPPVIVLSGYGNACDAYHQTASSNDGEGAFLAMQKALRMAGLSPRDIDYVNAHGTGTPNNDASESQALKRLFSPSTSAAAPAGSVYGGADIPASSQETPTTPLPSVSSTKGFTGHTTSASGAVEAVICLLAMQHSFLPANYGFVTPMPDGIMPVAHTVVNTPLRHVMCNSFGFGGNDTSIIFGVRR